MLQPMMRGTYRRNQSWANATWGDLTPEPTPIHRKPIERKTNKPESSKIRPKWIQNQKDVERVGSLLMIGAAIHIRNQRKKSSDQEDQLLPLRVISMESVSRTAIRKSKASSSSDKLKWNKQIKEAKALLREHSYGQIPMAFSQDQDLGKWSKRQRYNHMVHLKNQRRSQLKLNTAVFGSDLAEQAMQTPSEFCHQGLQLLNIVHTSNRNGNNMIPKEILLVPNEEPITTLEDDCEEESNRNKKKNNKSNSEETTGLVLKDPIINF